MTAAPALVEVGLLESPVLEAAVPLPPEVESSVAAASVLVLGPEPDPVAEAWLRTDLEAEETRCE